MKMYKATWMLVFACLLSFAMGVVPRLANAESLAAPQVETLPNGLTIVSFYSDRVPIFDLNLLVRTGFRNDPSGKSGLTELLSVVLDRGSGGKTAHEIALSVEKLGGMRSISIEDDHFNIGIHGLSADALELSQILGTIALSPDFPEAEVTREKVRLHDKWNHIEDYSDTLASIAFRRRIAARTPYGRGSLISAKEINGINRKDIQEYYKKYFTPQNSILVLIGKWDQVALKAGLQSTFGGWEGGVPQKSKETYADTRVMGGGKSSILIVDKKGLNQVQVKVGFRAPLLQVPERSALFVANAILGEFFESRLNQVIRDKLGLAYSVSSGFLFSEEFSEFSITSATRTDTSGKLVMKIIDVLKGFKKTNTIDEREVESGRNYVAGGFPLTMSTLGAYATKWIAARVFDLGPNYLNEFVPNILKVTRAEVQAAVRKHFNLDDLTIVMVGDAQAIRKSLIEAEWSGGKIHVIPVGSLK